MAVNRPLVGHCPGSKEPLDDEDGTPSSTVLPVCCGAQFPSSPQPAATGISDPKLDARVEALLRKMTREEEEKVGQLVQYSTGQPTGPGTGRTNYNDMIEKDRPGFVPWI